MKLALYILLFAVGLVLLIKGGDWFVDGSCGIAHKFKIPEILIGATIVSIGTTLPETMVSSIDAVVGEGNTAFGNAVGSVICNTALIASIPIIVKPTVAERKPLLLPVLFFFGFAIFYSAMAYCFGTFYRWVGILLLLGFVAYMFLSVRNAIKAPKDDNLELIEAQTEKGNSKKDVIFLIIGAVAIAGGAWLLVNYGQKIAESLGVPEKVIAIIFVALGTSLPELVTAITSLVKGHSSLSLGNLIGANLFNIILVSGLSITLHPFVVPTLPELFGITSAFIIDIPVMFAVMLILTVPTLIRGKLSRVQGIIMLLIYIAFCSLQFIA